MRALLLALVALTPTISFGHGCPVQVAAGTHTDEDCYRNAHDATHPTGNYAQFGAFQDSPGHMPELCDLTPDGVAENGVAHEVACACGRNVPEGKAGSHSHSWPLTTEETSNCSRYGQTTIPLKEGQYADRGRIYDRNLCRTKANDGRIVPCDHRDADTCFAGAGCTSYDEARHRCVNYARSSLNPLGEPWLTEAEQQNCYTCGDVLCDAGGSCPVPPTPEPAVCETALYPPSFVVDVEIMSDPGLGGIYTHGEIIEIRIHFERGVDVKEALGPTLTLDIGGTEKAAAFSQCFGPACDRIDFSYEVVKDDFDSNGFGVPGHALAKNLKSIVGRRGYSPPDLDLGDHAIANAKGHLVGRPPLPKEPPKPPPPGSSNLCADGHGGARNHCSSYYGEHSHDWSDCPDGKWSAWGGDRYHAHGCDGNEKFWAD